MNRRLWKIVNHGWSLRRFEYYSDQHNERHTRFMRSKYN